MASRIQGITVEIGGDTTKLTTALMIEIAKVVHADKIERLLAERAAKQAKIGEQIEQVIPKYTASNITRTDVKKTTNENSSSASRINNQAIIAESGISELDQAKINENKKDLELHNPRIEQEELEKKRQRETRAKEIERQNALVEAQNQPKKSYGDCSNNSNNCNSGSSTLVKGTVRQSLYKSSTAISEETKAKVLFSSAGCHTIFDSSECKFDYSAKKEYLRKTLYRRIGYASLEKIGEEIYRFVSTDDERNIIKNAGGKWIPYPREGRIGNVIVYEHVNIQDYITGWYKTETKVKNPNGSYTNWIRYYRRVGGK